MPRTVRPAPSVLDRRVSDLLASAPGALQALLDAGFTPLANPAARAMLAPTVTLRQAIALRGLDEARTHALLERLAALLPEGAACPS